MDNINELEILEKRAVIPLLLWLMAGALYVSGEHLLACGVLNKLDLPPIGSDDGSLSDYALNVWFWAGLQLLVTGTAIGASILSVVFHRLQTGATCPHADGGMPVPHAVHRLETGATRDDRGETCSHVR